MLDGFVYSTGPKPIKPSIPDQCRPVVLIPDKNEYPYLYPYWYLPIPILVFAPVRIVFRADEWCLSPLHTARIMCYLLVLVNVLYLHHVMLHLYW